MDTTKLQRRAGRTFFALTFLCLVNLAQNARGFPWSQVEAEIEEITVCKDPLLCRVMFESDYSNGEEEWNETAVIGPYHDLSFDRFLRMKCHCDPACIHYGDCCLDAAEKYSASQHDEVDEFWTCLPLRSKDNFRELDEMYTIYMVGKCPKNWPSNEDAETVRELCEVEYLDQSNHTYLKDIPVFSLRTNRTYANIYCATCHSDADSLAKWNISIGCGIDLDENNISRETMFNQNNYLPGHRTWTMEYNDTRVECSLAVDQFANVSMYLLNTKSRRCIPNLNSCDPWWPDIDDITACKKYTALVFDANSSSVKPYRNPHCAKCNNVLANDTTCYNKFSGRPRMLGGVPWISSSQFSFSMLFDFGFGDKASSAGHLGIPVKKCKDNEIYDYLRNRCHAVICGTMFVNENGTCVPRSEYLTGKDLDYLNSSCHRLIITENQDYVNLENGSIWLNQTNQVLEPKEFELVDGGGNVSICADRIMQDAYFRYSAGSPQRLLSDICLTISVICLALHIAIHAALPKLRNLPGKNLLSLSIALFFGQLLFLIGMGVRDSVDYELCAAIGIFTHWFYLSAFFWMNIMGFDICRTFSGSRLLSRRRAPGQSSRSTFTRYSCYAWGFPTVIVTVGMILDFGHLLEEYAPSYGTQVCWISNRTGLGILFILPVAIILFENLILFTHTVHSILQQREAAQFAVETNQSYRNSSRQTSTKEGHQPPLLKESNQSRNAKDKQQIRFILYIKLGLIMGLGWVFGFLAALAKIPALWYPFILFNGLQGAFIFAAFDCKRKIYYMLYYWATRQYHPNDTSSSSRATNSVTKMSVSSQRFSTTASNSLSSNDENGRLSRISAVNSGRQSPIAGGSEVIIGSERNFARRRQAAELVRRWLRTFSRVVQKDPNVPRVIVTKHFVSESALLEDWPRRRLTLPCHPQNTNLLGVKCNPPNAPSSSKL